jgi:glucose-1-phosphate thymidylyltransferase
VIEKRQDTKIGCIEEVAYRMGYINKEGLLEISSHLDKSGYGLYLKNLLKEP